MNMRQYQKRQEVKSHAVSSCCFQGVDLKEEQSTKSVSTRHGIVALDSGVGFGYEHHGKVY